VKRCKHMMLKGQCAYCDQGLRKEPISIPLQRGFHTEMSINNPFVYLHLCRDDTDDSRWEKVSHWDRANTRADQRREQEGRK